MRRRTFLQLAGEAAVASRAGLGWGGVESRLTAGQDAFLEELERRGCLYFWERASARTGQVLDRGLAKEGPDARRAASIAATGFGLSALCVADKRGFLKGAEVRERVRATLRFHLKEAPQEKGFFYHFMDVETGARMWRCELSSIDTTLLLMGVLTCRGYFAGGGVEREIREMATELYERVEWPWMLNGGTTFSMGWKPESGFLAARWQHYCELGMLYLLAIGSGSHPVTATAWDTFTRPVVEYEGYRYISGRDPLFTHQYTQAWFDLRSKRDRYADYFANSATATKAHKAWCVGLGAPYGEDYWGITASDSEHGYTAWGGPPRLGEVDGSVVPCAAAGSLAFVPQECVRVLMALKERYPQAWTRYGFVDAFHPQAGWYDADVLGIDQGISVLMAENARTGAVWEWFMRNAEARRALELCGFKREAETS